MKRVHKKWIRLAIVVSVLFVLVQVVGSFFFYNLAIKRGPKDFLQKNADLEVATETMDLFLKGDWIDWVNDQPFEQLSLTAQDGLELVGYFLAAEKPTNKLVILSHGYLGHAKQMGLYGQYYYEELGYHLFLPDARGHGKSEGDYYGFGWPDRLDLIDWTDQLIKQLGPDTEVVYHGLSMGAATVLMASGERSLPEQVKGIIADSPYQSLYQLFSYQMKRMFYLPPFPLVDSTSLLTKVRAGYGFREADVLSAVEKTAVPVFYIHGASDTFVPTRMTEELVEKTRSATQLLIVPHANHGESYAMAQEEYQTNIQSFIQALQQ